MMQTATFTLTFTTPAFLGDANQNARWRTPPIKHELRHWWRVAYAADHGFRVNVSEMRREEGLLFGHAWLDDDYYIKNGRREKTTARKSQVRLRLLGPGGIKPKDVWQGKTSNGVKPLDPGLDTSYAWFGLIKRGANLPDRNRLEPREERVLVLAFPDEHKKVLHDALRLIHTFATLGSRSRGGWGSVHLEGLAPLTASELEHYAQPIGKCLKREWAASLAQDHEGKLCVWHSSNSFTSWDKAIAQSARIRREIRTALKGQPDLRKALGFAGRGRMPSPLRWKVLQEGESFRLQVAAFPHALPADSGERMDDRQLEAAWKKIISALDQRLSRYVREDAHAYRLD